MPGGQLVQAYIINTVTGDSIQVMYNPEQLSLDQGNNFAEVAIPGLNAPPLQYVRGRGRTLSMDLFFDTYESGIDVRQFTDRLTGLLQTQPSTMAPPVLLFVMGSFIFQCVLVEAAQRFTMFAFDGTPARSTVSARFHEYVDVIVTTERGFFFGPPTIHNAFEGETVSAIAARILGDPARWREIADANHVENPFHLPAGTTLVIPGKAGT
jgi:Contractile injection system tube protein/LysM domain